MVPTPTTPKKTPQRSPCRSWALFLLLEVLGLSRSVSAFSSRAVRLVTRPDAACIWRVANIDLRPTREVVGTPGIVLQSRRPCHHSSDTISRSEQTLSLYLIIRWTSSLSYSPCFLESSGGLALLAWIPEYADTVFAATVLAWDPRPDGCLKQAGTSTMFCFSILMDIYGFRLLKTVVTRHLDLTNTTSNDSLPIMMVFQT